MFPNKILISVALLCGLSCAAYAEQADRQKQLTLTADYCDAAGKAGKRACKGNVQIEQGSMLIRAETLLLTQDSNDNITFLHGEGKPVKFKQKLDKSGEWLDAEALVFDYDNAKGILTLTEKVLIRKGEDVSSAAKVVYFLNTEETQVSGEPGKQLKIVLQPKQKEPVAGKPAP